MKAILITFLATCVGAGIFYSSETETERPVGEVDFEKKLKEGYDLLKDVPNEDDTVRFLEQLHNMEDEIKNGFAHSPQKSDELSSELKKYMNIKIDHIAPVGDSIEEINHNKKVDAALFQGDMILTKKQAEEIIEDIKANEGGRGKRQAYRDETYPETLWSHGVTFMFNSNATESAKRVFRRAAAEWSWDTCINFGEGTQVREGIEVIKSDGCWSYVGRIGGLQGLSLGEGCESVGTAAHEIGHALGLFHTQSRHDRDNFITIYEENVLTGWMSQFVKQTEKTNYNYNLTYDYGSVMQYGARSVSKNGNPVMMPRDIKYLQTLGSPIISFYEKLMINLHYKCLDKCKGSSSARCENGGIPHPRDCSKCLCPSGYGGKLCNERPRGCGNTLVATDSFQKLESTVGEKGATEASDVFRMCYYWIEAPVGSTIEIILDSFTQGMSTDGCRYAGVEIKTGNDKRHTGYRFCAPENAGTSLISTYNLVPIITYSRSGAVTAVFRYRIASSGPVVSQTTYQPTDRPATNPNCEDIPECTTLMKWNFCRSRKYDEDFRRLACPKMCQLC